MFRAHQHAPIDGLLQFAPFLFLFFAGLPCSCLSKSEQKKTFGQKNTLDLYRSTRRNFNLYLNHSLDLNAHRNRPRSERLVVLCRPRQQAEFTRAFRVTDRRGSVGRQSMQIQSPDELRKKLEAAQLESKEEERFVS